ncbi:hypothetical protein, partial [Neisseria chenwenguii]|uniref:hypothetical protein n=1 Tax=Neisseria chenwenguii TaxID=1853278 RepID=UPI001F2988FE
EGRTGMQIREKDKRFRCCSDETFDDYKCHDNQKGFKTAWKVIYHNDWCIGAAAEKQPAVGRMR